jgi:hypothetical protein
MKELIASYSGTAGHLYWLVTFNKHPKQNDLDFLTDLRPHETFKWDIAHMIRLRGKWSDPQANWEEQNELNNRDYSEEYTPDMYKHPMDEFNLENK